MCYHSCDPRDKKTGLPTHTERLTADLAASGGQRLVAEIESSAFDTYAMITRDEHDVYVAFRGSCTLKNAQIDITYQPADEATMEEYAKEAAELGVRIPKGIQVHAGFLDAWRSLRAQVIDEVLKIADEEEEQDAAVGGRGRYKRGLRLVVTGHSMGGAMAMFASLELASILKGSAKQPRKRRFRGGHLTYTLAAPRLGNAKFARYYNLVFPDVSDHWALQRSNDAIPHLPFAAWGFKHPHGVAFLEPNPRPSPPSTNPAAPAPPSTTIRRTGDRGDDLSKLRPTSNKAISWVSDHDVSAYLEPLQDLLRVSGAGPSEDGGIVFSA